MSGYRDLTKLENSRNCLRRIARHDETQFSKDSIVNVMERFVKTVKVMDDTILVPCRLMDRQVGDSTDIIAAPGKDSTSNQLTLNSSTHGKRGVAHSKNVHEFLTSSELFNLYNMLKALKNDLLWTGKDNDEDEQDNVYGEPRTLDELGDIIYTDTETVATTAEVVTNTTTVAANNMTASASTATIKGHNRRPSTASVASTVSVTSVGNMSDSESEISNENDSGMESDANKSDNPQSSSESVSGSEDARMQTKKAANADKATELAKRCRRHLNGLYQCLEQMTEAANYLTARYQSDIGPV